MKRYLIISLLFLSLGFSQKEYRFDDPISMGEGSWTNISSLNEEPVTGKFYDNWWDEEGNEEKVYMGNLLNGKREGKWVSYYHSNGKKECDSNYKDGKIDGLWTWWFENGQKRWERTYKDGKKDGLFTSWDEYGQKSWEGTYKDGERDGLFTWWSIDGWKSYEVTYKDRKVISKKEWNEDGSVRN